VTELVQAYGRSEGRNRLRAHAKLIRDELPARLRDGLADSIDLGSATHLPREYEAGSILSRQYFVDQLPNEDAMVADLQRMVRLFESARDARERLRVTRPGSIETPAPPALPDHEAALFKPKDDSEYRQQVQARTITKSRKHETLVRQYGLYVASRGFSAATNVHPRDLTAEDATDHWLIEAKIVYHGNGVSAARDALSQLLFYRHFLYPDPAGVQMLALFNQPVGDACVELLEELGVGSVWRQDGSWTGSPLATAAGLC